MKFIGVKDMEVEKEGVRTTVQQGRVMFIFDAYLQSDYEEFWESKPIFFFIKTLWDKYVFKSYFGRAEKWLVNDLFQLHGRIQQHLNIYRYERKI